MEKLFIVCTFDFSFQSYKDTIEQWLKEEGDEVKLDYDLVKINGNKSHPFNTVSNLEDFQKIFDTERAIEWDKANNCKDIIDKLELVE